MKYFFSCHGKVLQRVVPENTVVSVVSLLFRNFAHGPLVQGRDGQRGIHADIDGYHGSVAHIHILVAEYTVVFVDHHFFLVRSHHPTPENMGGRGNPQYCLHEQGHGPALKFESPASIILLVVYRFRSSRR